MKLSTISGASTLFCILAQVKAFSIAPIQAPLPVPLPSPDPNQEFNFQCPDGKRFTKFELMQVVLGASEYMITNTSEDQYPLKYEYLEYDIHGELWYHIMKEGPEPHYFVIFNLDKQIAGLIRRTSVEDEDDILEPCGFM
ncbi:BgTH12-04524 [Blumeria graminis f. sp. triticale]|uniref:BgTH12-04524 n=1 Tax=Blumeria graminis f. sp. triticale TaxID=1689686 RepID=A0A9W4DG58_BLUGR|nr:BgTH12-04524 [Blumeria graminis f. sp. triticale]